MKKLVRSVARRLGYSIARLPKASRNHDPFSPLSDTPILDLERIAAMGLSIPGMVTAESGKILFALCMIQQTKGAVVEVGSWQGRSSSFLARAVMETGNGPFYAIDHFRGNIGKEELYRVKRSDLSDLRDNFEDNLTSMGLWDSVTLLDMPNDEAVSRITEPIRFLFLDGDHTRAGVERDIELFFPKLAASAIVVFDDYDANFRGLVDAVNETLTRAPPRRAFTFKKSLVVRF
jgi:predicted O-methyltransferase YrrM